MKTLIVVAHPDLANSVINRHLLAEAATYPDQFTLHHLDSEYPDFQIDVAREQALIEAHDHIVLQFPVYWFSSPPLLKKWLDDVFTYGWAYGASSGHKLKGKTIALAVTAGIREADYQPAGTYRYPLDAILRPFEITTAYVSADWGGFYAFYNTENCDTAPLDKRNPDGTAADPRIRDYIRFISELNR